MKTNNQPTLTDQAKKIIKWNTETNNQPTNNKWRKEMKLDLNSYLLSVVIGMLIGITYKLF